MSTVGDLLTTRDASERAQRSVRTIRRWVASGRLVPTYTLPGQTGDHLFRAEDVDRAAGRDIEQAS
jgi:predicted site-specific integrase-resolvase